MSTLFTQEAERAAKHGVPPKIAGPDHKALYERPAPRAYA